MQTLIVRSSCLVLVVAGLVIVVSAGSAPAADADQDLVTLYL